MSELALDLFNAISEIVKLRKRIAELERLVETYTTSNGLRNRVLQDIVEKQTKRIAKLEGFKMIVEGCGFEVITEPPVLNHPARKILKGHGTIYVPELPEPPEVK